MVKFFNIIVNHQLVHTFPYIVGDDVEQMFKDWAFAQGLKHKVYSEHSFKHWAFTNSEDKRNKRADHVVARLVPDIWVGNKRPLPKEILTFEYMKLENGEKKTIRRNKQESLAEGVYAFALSMKKKGYRLVNEPTAPLGAVWTDGDAVYALVPIAKK